MCVNINSDRDKRSSVRRSGRLSAVHTVLYIGCEKSGIDDLGCAESGVGVGFGFSQRGFGYGCRHRDFVVTYHTHPPIERRISIVRSLVMLPDASLSHTISGGRNVVGLYALIGPILGSLDETTS